MIPTKFLCPMCKAVPCGTVEVIPGVALVRFDDAGLPYFAGETKVCWDGQTTERNASGEVLFQCGACYHEYAVKGVEKVEA